MAIIKVEDKGNYKIIQLEGDFVGGEEIEELRTTLKNLATLDKNKIVLNLEKVSYLNSTALGVLLSANALFEKHNGKLHICHASDYLENIFKITKLTYIFTLYKTLEEAEKDL